MLCYGCCIAIAVAYTFFFFFFFFLNISTNFMQVAARWHVVFFAAEDQKPFGIQLTSSAIFLELHIIIIIIIVMRIYCELRCSFHTVLITNYTMASASRQMTVSTAVTAPPAVVCLNDERERCRFYYTHTHTNIAVLEQMWRIINVRRKFRFGIYSEFELNKYISPKSVGDRRIHFLNFKCTFKAKKKKNPSLNEKLSKWSFNTEIRNNRKLNLDSYEWHVYRFIL